MGRLSLRARSVLATFLLTVPAIAISACGSSATKAPPAGNGNGFGDAGGGKNDVFVPPHKDAGSGKDAAKDAPRDVAAEAKADATDAKTSDVTLTDAKKTDAPSVDALSADASDAKSADALPFTDAATGITCLESGECGSGVCAEGAVVVGSSGHAADAGSCATHTCTCQAPSCTDGVQNGTETGVDCGGTCLKKCIDSVGCLADGDCVSGVCGGVPNQDGGPGSTCQAPSCGDGVKNGTETAVDCGSSATCPTGEVCQQCPGCTTGESCHGPGDCTSNICNGTTCSCPTGMTEASTSVGLPYCVDSYEVTFAQYQTFLNLTISVGSQPAECAFNTTFEPQGLIATPSMADAQNPVTNVDWCDALAYCANTGGKHLCGTVALAKTSTMPAQAGGQPVPPGASQNNSAVDEWYNACSNQGANTYPYGGGYSPVQCNGIDSPAQSSSGPVATPPGQSTNIIQAHGPCVFDPCNNPVDQYATVRANQVITCAGGKPGDGGNVMNPSCIPTFGENNCGSLTVGLFDMSGNVAEWENSCTGGAGGSDTCAVRGGSFDSPNGSASLTCAVSAAQPALARSTTAPDVGFRCCL